MLAPLVVGMIDGYSFGTRHRSRITMWWASRRASEHDRVMWFVEISAVSCRVVSSIRLLNAERDVVVESFAAEFHRRPCRKPLPILELRSLF